MDNTASDVIAMLEKIEAVTKDSAYQIMETQVKEKLVDVMLSDTSKSAHIVCEKVWGGLDKKKHTSQGLNEEQYKEFARDSVKQLQDNMPKLFSELWQHIAHRLENQSKYTFNVMQWYIGTKKKPKSLRRLEDVGRVRAALELKNRFADTIKKDPELVKFQDINQITFTQLEDLSIKLKSLKTKNMEKAGYEDELIKKGEAKVLLDNDEWKVAIPKSVEAARYYGRNTKWCTAMDDDDTDYLSYAKDGDLIVVIHKKDNAKYQLHFESQQYMDSLDNPLSTENLKRLGKEVIGPLAPVFGFNFDKIDFNTHDRELWNTIRSIDFACLFVNSMTEEQFFKYVTKTKTAKYLQLLDNPSYKLQKDLVRAFPDTIMYIKNPTDQLQVMAVKQDIYCAIRLKRLCEEAQLIIVKTHPDLMGNKIFEFNVYGSNSYDSVRKIYNKWARSNKKDLAKLKGKGPASDIIAELERQVVEAVDYHSINNLIKKYHPHFSKMTIGFELEASIPGTSVGKQELSDDELRDQAIDRVDFSESKFISETLGVEKFLKDYNVEAPNALEITDEDIAAAINEPLKGLCVGISTYSTRRSIKSDVNYIALNKNILNMVKVKDIQERITDLILNQFLNQLLNDSNIGLLSKYDYVRNEIVYRIITDTLNNYFIVPINSSMHESDIFHIAIPIRNCWRPYFASYIDYDKEQFINDYNEEYENQIMIEEDYLRNMEVNEDNGDNTEAFDIVKRHLLNVGIKSIIGIDDTYTFTTLHDDASIQGEGAGVEIVSPKFLNYQDGLKWLDTVLQMFKTKGYETNETTGFHINIGGFIPVKPNGSNITHPGVLDVIKLAIFSGDKYLLKTFNREANTYAVPIFEKLKSAIEYHSDIVDIGKELDLLIASANSHFISLTDHYASISPQKFKEKGYIEFRVAGGQSYHMDANKLKQTIFRFMQLCAISSDYSAFRKDYLKNLYTLLPQTESKPLFSGKMDTRDVVKYLASLGYNTSPTGKVNLSMLTNVFKRVSEIPNKEHIINDIKFWKALRLYIYSQSYGSNYGINISNIDNALIITRDGDLGEFYKDWNPEMKDLGRKYGIPQDKLDYIFLGRPKKPITAIAFDILSELNMQEILASKRIASILRIDELPPPYNKTKPLNRGTTSIIFENPEDESTVIVFTKDEIKADWLRTNNLILSYKEYRPTKNHPNHRLSNLPIYKIETKKLYKVTGKNITYANMIENYIWNYRSKTFFGKRKDLAHENLVNDLQDNLDQIPEAKLHPIIEKLANFVGLYEHNQFSFDIRRANFMQTKEGELVVNDPFVSMDLIRGLKGIG